MNWLLSLLGWKVWAAIAAWNVFAILALIFVHSATHKKTPTQE